MLTASGGAFLATLDSTVVNLAIPSVKHDIPGTSVTGLSWIISAYAVMFAALLAPSGKLADALGRRRLFVIGIGLFTVASLLCSLSPNLPFLIVSRTLQGAGAAGMIPASLAILLLDGPADRRASSIGLWSAASAVGAAVGPSIGGGLVELFSWRSVFLINIPFGIVGVIAAMRLLDAPGRTSFSRLPDPMGTALLALGVGALTVGVTEGGNWGWQSPRTLACLALGPVMIIAALLRSRWCAVPAVDTFLWRSRAFATANVISLLYGMALYPCILAGVLFMTGTWRYTELQAGLSNTPGALSASAAALAMGRYAPRLGGARLAALFGLAVFGACCTWLAFGLTRHPAFLTLWLPAGLVGGAGMGAATMGASASAATSAPSARFASSSGLNTTARQFGGALGVAAMAAILAESRHVNGGTEAYSHVFLCCAALLGVAVVIAAIWLRPTPWVPAAATDSAFIASAHRIGQETASMASARPDALDGAEHRTIQQGRA